MDFRAVPAAFSQAISSACRLNDPVFAQGQPVDLGRASRSIAHEQRRVDPKHIWELVLELLKDLRCCLRLPAHESPSADCNRHRAQTEGSYVFLIGLYSFCENHPNRWLALLVPVHLNTIGVNRGFALSVRRRRLHGRAS